jgi:signal transduction histidine kinase
LFGLSTLPLPVAIGVAVLQRRLFDLPLALNRAITYAGLCVVIALLYALVIGGVGAMLQQEDAAWLPWVAAGVVAVAFAPLRAALQNAANRVTYGQWSQPREVLARTGRRLADAGELDTLLATLVDELTVGLELGHVDITDKQGRVLASSGVESGETDGAPLWAYGEVVGRLRWTRRTLRDSDRELLADLARQLGGVVHTYALVRSLREAQERLVLAREEERRRLRRDLHDGLGPTLAALSLQVDTVRNRLGAGTRDDEVDDALLHLRGGIQATVLDVRRIVEGLRPPALDDLGLVEALHQLVEGSVVPAAVDAVALPRLPAAVEVAAYRVVQEALTNAVRHAQAEHVEVRVELCDGRLLVTVCDDGIGEVVPRTEGVGMSSMRERAEEIGGTFEVLPVAGRGTRVCVALPLETRAGHAS